MTDQLERELRAVLTQGAESVPASTIERLAQTDYQPRVRHALSWRATSASCGVLAAGIAAVIILHSSTPPSSPQKTTYASLVRVSYTDERNERLIGASLRDQFSVLAGSARRPNASAEGALKQPFVGFVDHIGNFRGASVAGTLSKQNAVYVQGPPGTAAVLIPGTTGVCFGFHTPPIRRNLPPSAVRLLDGIISGSCLSAAQVEKHGLGMLKFSPDDKSEAIIGMVPDGNTTVTATLADGTTVSVPVMSNMFYVKASTLINKVQFLTATGSTTSLG